ncbi:CLUMA_CG007732, isoform A [Clunio marinus]|uniref:CLUMA_CG007732, isoform A n=1 Tax=Clunio marinus TaxID=568069 RepID=A0A1J1I719_9DIPT|nr:CLUMA_CG007732, isoform A [Clunio marinus]
MVMLEKAVEIDIEDEYINDNKTFGHNGLYLSEMAHKYLITNDEMFWFWIFFPSDTRPKAMRIVNNENDSRGMLMIIKATH